MNTFRVLTVLLALLIHEGASAFLPAPGLSSPISNVTLKRFDGFLSVSSVSGATGYEFQYDTLSSFNSPHVRSVRTTGSSRNVYTDALLLGKKYFWRARAYNSSDTSSWSNPNNFTVFTKYELVSPSNGSSGPLNLLSGLSVDGNAKAIYLFELDTTPSMNSSMRILQARSDRWLIDSTYFRFGRKVYWRATAVNEYNDTLEWSPVWEYSISRQVTVYKVGTQPVDPEVVLQWPSLGVSEVQIRMDTLRSLSSGFSHDRTLKRGTVRDTLRELNFGTKYYYAIRAKFVDQYSDWSALDSFTVAEYIQNPSPGQNATWQNLLLTLSWGARKGVHFRVQLAADTFFNSLMMDTVLSARTVGFADTLRLKTVYFWRVRAFHSKDTSTWTPFRFSSYSGQLNLGPPYNNAKNLDVRIKLRFRKADWATSYILEVDSGKVFGPVLSAKGQRLTSFTDVSGFWNEAEVTLGYGADYVYRVFAIRHGDTSAPSVSATFSTKTAPTLYFPNNNYIGIGTQTNALIVGINGSDSVDWELDTLSDFSSPIRMRGRTAHVPDDFQPQYVLVEFPGDLRFETRYYWRVRCVNSVDSSPWSPAWSFVTTQIPWQNLPADKASGVPINPKLTWGVQGSAADYVYQYQVGQDATLASAPIKSLSKGSSAEVILSCAYSTTYYWRVRAFHGTDTSSWSAIWSFTTVAPPTIPSVQLFSPKHGSTNVPTASVELLWNSAANAESYDIQVASDDKFSDIVSSANLAATGAIMRNMFSNKTYYWRVRGRSGVRTGPWSLVWNFTTGTSVGIADFDDPNWQLYPNPAESRITTVIPEEGSISIYSGDGRLLHSESVFAGKNVVNTSGLGSGWYIFRYRSASYSLNRTVRILK
ncbi:MAG: T9SS type A sorting domain-containing protein [Flavobacteriales bacterium]|nr:T9SS type A sorting domain-containing protein [Flavobacteriales bacterium]